MASMNANDSKPETGPLPPDPGSGNRLSIADAEIGLEKQRHARRRLLGLVLGAALGLAFGLVSQYGNDLLVRGVPLYHPPFGAAGNLFLCVIVGTVLGLVTAWPKHAILGAIAGCVAGALLAIVGIMLVEGGALDASKATVTLFTFLPIAAVLALPVGIIRWVLSKEEHVWREGALGDPVARSKAACAWRILRPLLLVAIAAAWGGLFVYPERAQIVLPRMNAIVQAGLSAADRASLPAEFQTIDDWAGTAGKALPGYPQQAKGSYTLDFQEGKLGRFGIPRPTSNEGEQSAVIARFDNGWSFVCLFIRIDAKPRCGPLYVAP